MVTHLVRAMFLVVVLAITISFGVHLAPGGVEYVTIYMVVPAALGVAVVFIDMFWRRKPLQMLSGLFFGVLAGLAISYIVTLVIDMVVALFVPMSPAVYPGPKPVLAGTSGMDPNDPQTLLRKLNEHKQRVAEWEASIAEYDRQVLPRRTAELIKLLVGAAIVFLCVSFVLQTKDDFRFVIPYVEFAKETKGARPLLLDTSVIIDGRVADIAETGVLESEMLVPRFVLAEIQAVADSDDKLKRNRGRRGLDILNRLQQCKKATVRIIDPHVPEVEAAPDVDAKLLALAGAMSARVVTNDYNLNKVARLRNVDVFNINDLANALKPVALPGEKLSLRIIKPGEEPGQGVGYLPDGTMIVAEQGRDHIGKDIVITVTSVLQTSAGRMVFGRLDAERTQAAKEHKV